MPSYEIGGDIYVVDPSRELLFRYEGRTRNPRVIALHDAAVWKEQLDTVHTNGTTVLLQHHVAGIERRIYAGERLDEPVAVFSEVDQLYAGDVVEAIGGDELAA